MEMVRAPVVEHEILIVGVCDPGTQVGLQVAPVLGLVNELLKPLIYVVRRGGQSVSGKLSRHLGREQHGPKGTPWNTALHVEVAGDNRIEIVSRLGGKPQCR